MIFLLPPSETKQIGGVRSKPSLSFPQLESTRTLIQKELVVTCQEEKLAIKALGLGPKQLSEIQINLELSRPKVMPAIDRYTGVLYDALKDGELSVRERQRAKKFFIQSSLFGLICALDQIPNYRLSATSKLPGLSLKSLWNSAHDSIWETLKGEQVIDFRSKQYVALAPVPKNISSYFVDVVSEDSKGNRTSLNHFNKQAKGKFLRAVLRENSFPKSVANLQSIASKAGLHLEVSKTSLLLITYR
jgi:uncharacterized protein